MAGGEEIGSALAGVKTSEGAAAFVDEAAAGEAMGVGNDCEGAFPADDAGSGVEAPAAPAEGPVAACA